VSEIVVGVVLVAGESTRLDLGYPKQLLDVDGRSMARVSVEAAVASSSTPTTGPATCPRYSPGSTPPGSSTR
jgi:2-C-methyl-D-erythritol 4-phosphate cytidylyltransferase